MVAEASRGMMPIKGQGLRSQGFGKTSLCISGLLLVVLLTCQRPFLL